MDKKAQIIQRYNNGAKELAKRFDNIGARIKDIEEVFSIFYKKNPKVLEIGCGNGRDAKEIIKKSNDYLGIDISRELIKIARDKVPKANFEVADIVEFNLPLNLDIVFAFASLIHVNKDEFRLVLSSLWDVMNTSGLVRLSLVHSDDYQEITKGSDFGLVTYYHYSEKDIEEIAIGFVILMSGIVEKGGIKWLEIILKKQDK